MALISHAQARRRFPFRTEHSISQATGLALQWKKSEPSAPGARTKSLKRLAAAVALTLITIAGTYTGTQWRATTAVRALVVPILAGTIVPNRQLSDMLDWSAYVQVLITIQA